MEDPYKTMKKLNFRTFKFQIVLLFLLMSVPAMGLALAASYTITDAGETGLLSYLEGQTFTVPRVDFVKALFPDEAGKL